jgi:TolA-binding protein
MARLKVVFFFLFFCCHLHAAFSQETHSSQSSVDLLREAQSLFNNEQYALAYPLFQQLKKSTNGHSLHQEDINYGHAVCGLKLMNSAALEEADLFVLQSVSPSRISHMRFHTGHYHFLTGSFADALQQLDRCLEGPDVSKNTWYAQARFEWAYASFALNLRDPAMVVFESLSADAASEYQIPATYYAGFCRYQKQAYDSAFYFFRQIAQHAQFNSDVPYYMADILLKTGKKEEALFFADSVLTTTGAENHRLELGLLAAKLHVEKKNFHRALPLYDAYLNAHEKVSKDILYEWSFCHYKNGDPKKAIQGFKELSNEKDSVGQNSMYLLGELYLKAGDKQNARSAFQYCAQHNYHPDQQRVSRLNYAKLSAELGFPDMALSDIRAYIRDYGNYQEIHPEVAPDAHLNEAKELLISLLTNTTNYDEGLAVYNTLSKTSVSAQKVYSRLLYGKAMQWMDEQKWSEADSLFVRILDLGVAVDIIPYARFWSGELAYRQKNYDRAVDLLTVFISGNHTALGEANTTHAKYSAGYAWIQKGNYTNALGLFESIKDGRTTNTGLYQDLIIRKADCQYMLRNYPVADALYKNAIDSNFLQADYALFQRAVIAGISNKETKIKYLKWLKEKYPDSYLLLDADMELAITLMNEDRFSEAIPLLDKIAKSPDAGALLPKSLMQLGLAHFNNGDNTKSLSCYQNLIRQFPHAEETEDAMPLVRQIYIEMGKADEYLELMKANGIVVDVDEADSLSFTSAMAKYNRNDYNGSITAFEKYIQQYPKGAYLTDVQFSLGMAALRVKDFLKADKALTVVFENGKSKYFESATLELARMCYLEKKEYNRSKQYFEALYINAVKEENKLEGLRGLVRSYFQLKDYTAAQLAATDLAAQKGSSTDDKSVALLVLGKSLQAAGDTSGAINAFKQVIPMNKASWGAEARYELAHGYYTKNNLSQAEKTAMLVIKETGSYEFWVTKSYILLGDIFLRQKDLFNAKATYQSVADNATITELKEEARMKYEAVLELEKKSSKIN